MKYKLNLDRLFQPLSKAVIIIPVAVVIIALFFKVYDKMLPYRQVVPSPTPTPVSQPNDQEVTASSAANTSININGSYSCQLVKADQTAKINIKNKRVYGELTTINTSQHFLLNGDCFYEWKAYNGEKTCGLSQMMDMYEAAASLGALDFNAIIAAIISSGYVPASNEAILKETVDTCQKVPVPDNVFSLPANIVFKENDTLKNLVPHATG